MSNLYLVTDPDSGLEYVYVDGKQVASGEPIYAETWADIIRTYKCFDEVKEYNFTEEFGERVDWDYNKVPKNFEEFIEGDLELICK